MSQTLLDQIEDRVRAASEFNENAEVAPAVVLWPDRDRQFQPAVDQLRDRLPILTLGDLDEGARTGPAYWLRCAIAGTVDVELGGATPVVYLPGFGREDLRAIEGCPRELAPIAELQYRGQWFAHPNGKDWTVRALLTNKANGLGLDAADDATTTAALLAAFDQLLRRPARTLAQQFIDADLLQRLINPDPIATLLEWLDDPAGFRQRADEAQWQTFVNQCRAEYDFDPGTDGEVIGGRELGERQGIWAEVWKRFAQDPEKYPSVEERLRKGKPTDQLTFVDGAWPQDNDDAEASLRAALERLADSPASEARTAIRKLWSEHRSRTSSVWAKLDRAPLAFALEHLDALAEATNSNPTGDVSHLRSQYAEHGWQADAAFLSALAAAPDAEQRQIVTNAGLAVYKPWLDASSRALQEAIGPLANAGTYEPEGSASNEPGTVTVFVDGLRLDLAHRLESKLGGLDVSVDHSLAALPTVTDTAKPALTPVPAAALGPGGDLGPAKAGSGTKATIAVLRTMMEQAGGQVLSGVETGDPAGWAWTEAGRIDATGHDCRPATPAALEAFLQEIERSLDDIARQVRLLLDAGWRRVEIVTDHGWLLVPGGMEKVELPAATVEKKKGRCARLKPDADVSVPTVPWHWDVDVTIALAPGITCFEVNQEYEHGGVSLQECVVPRVRITTGATTTTTSRAAITKVKWLGLMCRVEFENVAPGATVDIRAMPAEASTSVAVEAKDTTSAGKQSLYVEDEDLEGERAYLVIVGTDGTILAQRDVEIGRNR